MSCVLCGERSILFHQDVRRFYQCSACGLIFVPREEALNEESEKARYEDHQNHADDEGYRSYLENIARSIRPHLREASRGLDFGSGKTTVLADLLQNTDSYDKYFRSTEDVFHRTYDFIVLCEVIEHLRELSETMSDLRRLLEPRGQFFIKTKFYPESRFFPTWFYKRDLTHIQFFQTTAMEKLAVKLGMNVEVCGDDLYRMFS